MNFPICINCKNFAYWNGDFCCVEDMRVLEYGGKLTEEALEMFPQNCDGFKKETNKNLINLRKEVIETLIDENVNHF